MNGLTEDQIASRVLICVALFTASVLLIMAVGYGKRWTYRTLLPSGALAVGAYMIIFFRVLAFPWAATLAFSAIAMVVMPLAVIGYARFGATIRGREDRLRKERIPQDKHT